jgi:hypothetical protein
VSGITSSRPNVELAANELGKSVSEAGPQPHSNSMELGRITIPSPLKVNPNFVPKVTNKFINQQEERESQGNREVLTTNIASNSPEYLLLCFSHWGFKTKLIHLDISDCGSDMAMFQRINEKYYGTGKLRRLRNLLSLRTLSRIEFVGVGSPSHNVLRVS